MKRVFRSKVGLELLAPLVIIMTTVVVLLLMSGAYTWTILVIPVLTSVFITHMFLTTYYTISGDELRIRCGFLMNIQISIATITRIKETSDPTSAPAISLDRLRIEYGNQKSILISPKEKQAFIDMILSLNNAVAVKYKKEDAIMFR
ncbi:MAG: hypothetical protein EOP54_03860 [Sphingobacteriales bacterium]|nr:MAG: hypothetical protein EOP54_03860 [Sphingobacteriales bacterium]